MLLIDAVFINDSGGKVLLDYLISNLETTNCSVTYLLDERVLNKIPKIKGSNKQVYLSGFVNRCKFYKSINSNDFKKVLCFGNIPPNIRLSADVYTYFHQLKFVEPLTGNFKSRFLIKLKKNIIKFSKKNTDFWVVQTSNISQLLSQNFNISNEKILKIPFYVEINPQHLAGSNKLNNSFLYISNGHDHKNHIKLINAFCDFYDKFKVGKLTLTITKRFEKLYGIIEWRKKNGYPIVNLEYVPHNELADTYLSHQYLIYPSLSESFGLGIIEGIDCGCKVIGSDLPYMLDVCEPSLKFNPFVEESIYQSFVESYKTNLKISVKKIDNEIENLINILIK